MIDAGDDALDTQADAVPDVADSNEEPPEFTLDESIRYAFQDGKATVIIEDQSDESKGARASTPRPELKAETLETRYLDDQFAAQVMEAEARYQRSLGDITAGADVPTTPDIAKAAETLDEAAKAMSHAINQLLEHWNANRR